MKVLFFINPMVPSYLMKGRILKIMFKLPHLIVLIFTFILTFSLYISFRNKNDKDTERLIKILAILSLFFDPIYWIWEIYKFGKFDFSTTLPLYICSMFWILAPISAFRKDGFCKQTATAYICTISTIGGVFGLIFNIHLNNHPFFSFIPIRSLIYHVIMLAVSSIMWSSGFYKVKKWDWFRIFIPVILMLIPSLILNYIFGWDYLFTAGGIGTPLEILSKCLPKPLYLLSLYGSLYFIIRFTIYRKFKPLFLQANDNL
ncbi:MAG: hypothetical protein ACRDA4_01255 [Filifactoraceae bacterium]